MVKRLWSIKEYPFHPEKLRYYETIFTIGNGYLGTRASFEERYEEDTSATLIHGIFNHAPNTLVPELVNAPDWTRINLTIDDTPFKLITQADNPFNPPDGLVLGYERRLHMDIGLLRRVVLFRAITGNTVRIVFDRFASLADEHLMVQRVHITAIDGTPKVTLTSVLDGNVTNNSVVHWGTMQADSQADNVISLSAKTNQSGYELGMASKLISPEPCFIDLADKSPSVTTVIQLEKDGEATFEKYTAIYTSRDADTPLQSAYAHLDRLLSYDEIYQAHAHEWQKYWDVADIKIKGDEPAQVGVRFATYHVLIAAPRHDDDVNIGAKTLSGFGYKGHVFWDTELFMMPPLTLTLPHMARNLLMYRYKRLDGARQKAIEYGYEGAMYPWESTDTGIETTPKWTAPVPPDNQRIRIWTGEIELHIMSDIAYGILQYWRWTGDDEFLTRYGTEMVLDTAVFWGSRVESRNSHYEMTDVIGPDEYHEHVNNNGFTNRMAQWHLQQALELLSWLEQHAPRDYQRLVEQLDLKETRINLWRDIINNMWIPFDEDKQIHIQFDDFFELEYIPVQKFEPRVGGIWGYLGHERASQSQVIKQADVVMMMALLGDKTGSRDVMLNNWNTYYPRCDHGSSLSPAMHTWVAARLGLIEEATHMLNHAIAVDLEDNKGNVHEGIHGAASGGLWQAIVFGLCGLQLTDDKPVTSDPMLPKHWEEVSFTVMYRGVKQIFTIRH
jgi:trehalose/maltose hydrolase-like predicted phosphorylase